MILSDGKGFNGKSNRWLLKENVRLQKVGQSNMIIEPEKKYNEEEVKNERILNEIESD